MTDPIKKSSVALGFELVRSLREGGGTPVEADSSLNDASRAVIDAMREKYGKICLGQFNPSHKNPQTIDVLWIPKMFPTMNFEADFVIPKYDHQLARMLVDRLSKYTDMKADSVNITAIQERIRELGGELLTWS